MSKPIIICKLTRNVMIALVSAAWVVPASVWMVVVLRYLTWIDEYILREEYVITGDETALNAYPFLISGPSPFWIAEVFLKVGSILLFVCIFCWVLIATNKLWPIKGKKTKKAEETQ